MAIHSDPQADAQNEVEVRSFAFQLRAADPSRNPGMDPKKGLAGHAAVFGVRTQLYPGMTEEIDPAAFDSSLKDDDIYMCFNHNPDIVLCGTKNGSLRFAPDAEGLGFDSDIVGTHAGADAYELVRAGIITEMSFGFIIKREEWDESDPNIIHRIIKEVRLLEISPVLFPAYTTTSVMARAQNELAEFRSRRNNLPKEPEVPVLPVLRHDLAAEVDRIRKKMLLDKIDKEV